MSSNRDLLAGLVFLVLGILAVGVLIPYGIQQPPSVQYRALSPSYWPNIVAGALAALGLALIVSTLLSGGGAGAREEGSGNGNQGFSTWLMIRPLIALAICFALYFGLEPLGFVLTTAIAVTLLMLLAGEYRLYIVLPAAIIVPFGLHLFFTKAASVPIPMGILEPLLLRI